MRDLLPRIHTRPRRFPANLGNFAGRAGGLTPYAQPTQAVFRRPGKSLQPVESFVKCTLYFAIFSNCQLFDC